MSKQKLYLQDAQDLYVEKGKDVKEIAELLPVHLKTLYRWSTKYGWVEKRRAYLCNTQATIDVLNEQIRGFVLQLKEAETNDERFKLADSISKLNSVKTGIQKKFDDKGSILVVMDKFARFIKNMERDRAKIDLLTDYVQRFLEYTRDH